MQREILFRGKRVDNWEWAEGYYVADTEWAKYYIYQPQHTGVYIELRAIKVHPESVSQFTGLLDKNGNRIFFDDTYRDPDGDVFKVTQNEYGTYVLEMISNGFIDEFIDWDKIEIIGNIHDNPDLLK